jgi:3-hydroxyisobutyrate dehydrogenase-like beta-hydroxyacid dehydrogenase
MRIGHPNTHGLAAQPHLPDLPLTSFLPRMRGKGRRHTTRENQSMATTIRRVGMIGLGKMGNPMCRHLRKAGFEVIGTDVSEAARRTLEAADVKTVATSREVAAASDFVIVVVGFDSEAETVILGADGIAAGAGKGLIVGVASTVAPRTMTRIAAQLKGTGITLIDMPLTRGEGAAEAGKMLTMVGGDEAAFAAVKPALDTFADSVFHVGALGSGQVGKMVNNLILWACISANHEGFRLAEALGADPTRLRMALIESSASNWAMETQVQNQPMPWAEKDMRIVMAEADKLRLALPLCGVVKEVVKSIKFERGWPTPEEPD